MSLSVTLEVPDVLAQGAVRLAKRTERRLEDVLLEWLEQGAKETPVELLSDEQLLLVTELQLPFDLQHELSELLALNREGQLEPSQQIRLNEVMQRYRRGLVRKAQATREAVARGLRPSLSV